MRGGTGGGPSQPGKCLRLSGRLVASPAADSPARRWGLEGILRVFGYFGGSFDDLYYCVVFFCFFLGGGGYGLGSGLRRLLGDFGDERFETF